MRISDNIVFVSSAPDANAMAAALSAEIANRYPPPQYRIIETATGDVLYDIADTPELRKFFKSTTWQEAELWHVETVGSENSQ